MGYVLLAMLAPYLQRQVHRAAIHRRPLYSRARSTVAVVICHLADLHHRTDDRRGGSSRFLGVSSDNGHPAVGMAIVFAYAVFWRHEGHHLHPGGAIYVLILAYTVPAVFISLQLTGNAFPQLPGWARTYAGGDVSAVQAGFGGDRPGFWPVHHDNDGSTLNMFMYTLSLMIGTASHVMRFSPFPR
jgi:cation/acetate symporter